MLSFKPRMLPWKPSFFGKSTSSQQLQISHFCFILIQNHSYTNCNHPIFPAFFSFLLFQFFLSDSFASFLFSLYFSSFQIIGKDYCLLHHSILELEGHEFLLSPTSCFQSGLYLLFHFCFIHNLYSGKLPSILLLILVFLKKIEFKQGILVALIWTRS